MLYGKMTQKRYLCRLIKLHYPNNNNAAIMMIHPVEHTGKIQEQ